MTSMHEHALIDLGCYFQMPEEATERDRIHQPVSMERLGTLGRGWWYNRDNCTMLDERTAAEELTKWRLAGGGTVVDTTSLGIGRDPLALSRISRASGVGIVMGASHYVPDTYDQSLHARGQDEIADSIVRDVETGVDETGIRAGIIGEVGNYWPTNETSRRILRASAEASARTGAAVTLHPGFSDDALMHHMSDLLGAGADPGRIIMGHVDTMSVGAVREVAQTGAYVQFDTFGFEDTLWAETAGQEADIPSDDDRIDKIFELLEWGFQDRLLIAHDVCFKTMLIRYGGKGFAHLIENIVPRMRRRGISQSAIEAILIDNPRRALTFP